MKWTVMTRIFSASRSLHIPVCINSGRWSYNHLYSQHQIAHAPLSYLQPQDVLPNQPWHSLRSLFALWTFDKLKTSLLSLLIMLLVAKQIYLPLHKYWQTMPLLTGQKFTPTGYKVTYLSRYSRGGGGTSLLYRGNLNGQKIAAKGPRSFEYWEFITCYITSSGTFKFRLAILYCSPYSPGHPVTTKILFLPADFTHYL